MSDTRKNHLTIDGGQVREDERVASYKPIPESDTDFKTSKASLHKSKEKLSPDGAEEKLLQKEDEAKIVTRVDMVDAKYAVGDHRNGDAKIELDANKRYYTGISREELLKYAEDPFWVRLRWFLFVLFWAMWLCMLVGAVVIIVRAPKCPPPTPRTWYENGPLVGVSDMAEVEKELPLLEATKVSGVFTHACNAYEVLDKSSTCLEQFKAFAAKAKQIGVQVIVDLTANFVSKTHTWFQLSENKTGNYTDYFIWARSREFNADDPSGPKPPNEWLSTKDTPAWTYSEKRQEFYLHQFGEDTPDLNFHNEKVVQEFDAVIKAWMQAGAAGIRLHKARELLVNVSSSTVNPRTGRGSVPDADHTQYAFWQHRDTRDQAALDGLLAHWSHMVATNANGIEQTVFTIAESSRPELFALAHDTSSLRPAFAAPVPLKDLRTAAAVIKDRLNRWPALQLTVEDGADEELAVFAMLLPAAPVLTLQQLRSRENETNPSASVSEAAALRADRSIQHGAYSVAALAAHNSSDGVIACARWKIGHSGYVGVYNPSEDEARADLAALRSLPGELSVYRVPHSRSNYTIKTLVRIDDVVVPPKSTIILTYVPKTLVEE